MTVAHDASTQSGLIPATPEPFEFTHTPVGTPRGVVVFVVRREGTPTDFISAVTYGGVAMARLQRATVGTEPGDVYLYFLGSSIPTGAQTVSIDHDGSITSSCRAYAISVTADADTEASVSNIFSCENCTGHDVDLDSGVDEALRYMALMTGANSPVGHTPLANTTTLHSTDEGLHSLLCARESAVSTGATTIGYTAGAGNNAAIAGVGVSEAAAPPAAPTNPAAVAISSSQIDISWNDVADETSYRVERSLDGLGSWVDVSGVIAADTTSYSDTGLDPSTEYFYRVIATNAGGDSDPSDVVSATTDAAAGGGGGDNRMTGGAIRKPPRVSR